MLSRATHCQDGLPPDPENTARATMDPEPPMVLTSTLPGALLDGRTLGIGFQSTEHWSCLCHRATGERTPPPPRWRWHPLPQSLHTLSYLEERFPIYGLQSRHTTLPLLLGREDRRPCHQFYTANCCSVYISTMEIRERLAKKQLNRRSTSLLTKSVYGVPSSKYSHLSIFLLNPRLKRLIRFIDNI